MHDDHPDEGAPIAPAIEDGLRFEQLCDDVIRQVFAKVDYRQRTQSAEISRRFGRLMPLITVDEDIEEFSDHLPGHCRRKTPRTYLNILTRSPNVKTLQFHHLFDTNYLQEQTFKDFTYVSRYVHRLAEVSKSLTTFEIRNQIRCSNRSDLQLATAVLKALGDKNQVERIKLDVAIYNPFSHEIELLARDLAELFASASKLKTLELSCSATEEGLESETATFRARSLEIKLEFTKFWGVIRKTVENLDLKFYTADLFYGRQHWTSCRFEKLESLVIGTEPVDILTGDHVKNIGLNMPTLKRLHIRTDKLCWITHLSKLTNSRTSITITMTRMRLIWFGKKTAKSSISSCRAAATALKL